MDQNQLISFGMNKNEAGVYLSLLKSGNSSAGELIKITGFHRNIVYDNLDKLIDKGLVTFIIEGKKRVFQTTPAEMISDLLEKEQTKLDKKKKLSEEIKKEISKFQSINKVKQEASIFRGKEGIRFLLKDTLDVGEDYFVFGAPKSSLEIMGSPFWENYNLKRNSNKIHVKMVFNESLRAWSQVIKNPKTKVKFLKHNFEPLSETIIYGDKVAIFVWSEKPIATLIKDKNLAQSYKQYFNLLWKQAQP